MVWPALPGIAHQCSLRAEGVLTCRAQPFGQRRILHGPGVTEGLYSCGDSSDSSTTTAFLPPHPITWDHIGWAVLAIEAKAESAQQSLREHRLPTISSTE